MRRFVAFNLPRLRWSQLFGTLLVALMIAATPWVFRGVSRAETPTIPETLKQDTQGKMVLLDFYSDYCSTCQMMAPKLRMIQRKTRGQIAFKHIDVADESNKAYWDQFHLQGTPTYVLYNQQGKPVYKMQDLITPLVLEKQLLRQTGQLKPIEVPDSIEIPLLSGDQPDSLKHLLLLSFENKACDACQEMTPYLSGFEISGKPDLKVIHLDSDTENGKKLMAQLGIKQLPAFALLDNSIVSPENLANNRRGELFVLTGKVQPRLLWDVIRLFGESGV